MLHSATLIPNWGDGSGTGTGGTLGLPAQALKMWQGQWSPVVYRFSSNWKELKTLHLTLLQITDTDAASVHSTTVFYFTDNSTTYYGFASGWLFVCPNPSLPGNLHKAPQAPTWVLVTSRSYPWGGDDPPRLGCSQPWCLDHTFPRYNGSASYYHGSLQTHDSGC